MSKAKKIISMLLAVAMVLTVAPVNLLASAADPEYSYGDVSFSKTDYTVDTSATTEVIRIAAASGSFSVPAPGAEGVIVSATPAGIPSSSGMYAHIAYAGETPALPKVSFSITGVTLDGVPTVSASGISGFTSVAQTPTTSGSTTTYTWNISAGTDTTNRAVVGANVVFTITYKIKGVAYYAYAYSHVEHILVMPGYVGYIYDHYNYLVTKKYSRHAAIGQVQSINMYTSNTVLTDSNGVQYYSGMNDPGTNSKTVGYINYASNSGLTYNSDNEASLDGCGNSDNVSSGGDAYASAVPNANIGGTEVAVLIKGTRDGNDSDNRQNFCIGNDGNRAEPIIYIDRRKHATLNDLKMKVTVQSGEDADNNTIYLNNIYFYKTVYNSSDENNSDWSGADADSNVINRTIVTSSATNASSSPAYFGNYLLATIGGTGPAESTTPDTPYTMIVETYSTGGSETEYIAAGINLDFRVYDSTVLWEVYYGVINGVASDGNSTYTTPADWTTAANYTCYFQKGANPQPSRYTEDSWNNFKAQLDIAGTMLATPDITQAELDQQAVNLYVAYDALAGYNPTVNWQINHYLEGTTTPLIPTQTVDPTETVYGQGQPAGSVWLANCATITGYECTSATTQNMTLSGQNASETLTFYYKPQSFNLITETNTDAGAAITLTQTGTKVYEDSLDYGTKDFYTFLGWYYDDGVWSQPVFSDSLSEGGQRYFVMPASQTTIYARWEATPIDIQYVPIVDGVELGTVDRGESVSFGGGTTAQFARPDDLYVDGYLFVNFYADKELTTPVSFPLTFTLGVTTTPYTIYARMVDVNGKISFESNGGTAVSDIAFTAGQTVSPNSAPTKKGYTFAGWFEKDNVETGTTPDFFENGTAANGWTDGTETMADNTGFIAYAKWTPNEYTISFELGEKTSEFDTVSLPSISGLADSAIATDDMPATPKKFGYVFHHWELNGERYDLVTYPTEDITLTPYWVESDYSAFIKIDSYEKLSGNYVETSTAQVGDVVTFRMTSQTNFYTGSSLFVFMYDKDFFELVNTDDAAFKLNSESEYISGIDATAIGTTTDNLLPWPDSLATARNDYQAMMVAIDPQVTATNDQTAPMSDGKWIVEFQLRVKADATGSGKVYMSNDWTRTPDNIMGTMFYGWSNGASDVYNTYNNVVVPDLDAAVAEISIDETVTPNTTVKLNSNGGVYASTTETYKTYEGRAETQIMDYEAPTRTGYTLAGWTNTADSSTVDWTDEFYYPTADNTETVEYNANWEANMYPVTFYKDDTLATVYYKLEYAYDSEVTGPPATPAKTGYTFKAWVNVDTGAEVTLPYVCDGEASFYPTYTPNTNTKYIIRINYFNNYAGADATFDTSLTGTTGHTVSIVETAGSEANTIYYTPDTLPTLRGYEYDPDNNTLPISGTIAPDGSLVLEVNYKASMVDVTINANGGTFTDGSSTMTISGEFQTLIDEADLPTADEMTRYGYTFTGWGTTYTAGTTRYTTGRTITAQWTANSHTITFDAGIGAYTDGTTSKTATVAFGGAIAAPEVPSKEGYTFLGWKAADGSDMPATLAVDEDVTYTASFEKTPYNVNYYVDGALDTDRSEVKYIGDAVTIASEPTKYGYNFSGWKLADDSEAADFEMGAADVDIYGEFTAKELGVVFDANGGSWTVDGATVESQTINNTFDTTIKNFPANNPTRAGYEFLGWAASETDATAKNTITSWPTLTTEDTVTYYAVWNATIWDYTVEFYYQDVNGQYGAAVESETLTFSGQVESTVSYNPEASKTGFTLDTASSELSGTVSVENPLVLKVKYARNQHTLTIDIDGTQTTSQVYYGTAVNVPANPEKTGYDFTGWNGYTEGMTMPDEDLTITAVFEAKQFTVTYYTDSTKAEVAYTRTAAYGSDYTVPNPTKEGHEFSKWLVVGTDADSGLAADATTQIPLNGAEYYATWNVLSYNLVYRANGGTWADGNTKTYLIRYGTAQADWDVPENPERVGYAWNGWNMTSAPATMPAQQVNILGQWTQETYTVIFKDSLSDEVYNEESLHYSDAVTIPEPEKEGYTFLHWADADGNEVTPMDTMEDIGNDGATVTYTAIWDANEYTITFVDTGDVAYEAITQDYGTTIATVADPVKTGYTFTGWDTTIPATMPAEDLTITATWKINQYTITFVDTGDVAYEAITKDYKAAVGTVADPVKTGYTFTGWDKDIPSTMPAENVTITAQWKINQYTITFANTGDSTIDPITQDYATAVTAPSDPVKTGYTFTGWDKDVPTTMPAENVTITAQWKINQYTITFANTGDSTIDPITQDYGTAVTAPSNPEKAGYTFGGWDKTIPTTMPAENVTITAKWNVNQYTITFDMDGGDAIAPITQDYNTAIDATAIVPNKTGYTFGGWVDADGAAADIPATMPAESITLKATWTINQYTITFDMDGGDAIAPITQDYNTAIDATVIVPNKTGYTFTGWVDADGAAANIPATMPAENITLKATWMINTYTVTFLDAEGETFYEAELEYNATIAAPTGTPDKEFYIFVGWSLTAVDLGTADTPVDTTKLIDFDNAAPTVIADDMTIYPAFDRVTVTLTLVADSTAVVDKERAEDPITGYIYGLREKLKVDALTTEYLAVEGDGRLNVIPTKYNRCGTGTEVQVIDNVTDEVVELYYIIIFGDVNGDSAVDAADISAINAEAAGMTTWSLEYYKDAEDTQYDYCKILAADIAGIIDEDGDGIDDDEYAGDGIVNGTDSTALNRIVLGYDELDQTSGMII